MLMLSKQSKLNLINLRNGFTSLVFQAKNKNLSEKVITDGFEICAREAKIQILF